MERFAQRTDQESGFVVVGEAPPAKLRKRLIDSLGRLGNVVKDYAPGLAALGVLLFAIRYGSYLLFYESFGVSPGEVGLGYSEALVQAIIATTFWAALGGVVLLVVIWCVGWVATLLQFPTLTWAVFQGVREKGLGRGLALIGLPGWPAYAIGAAVAVVIFQAYLLVGGWHFGNRADHGHPLAETELFPETFTDWNAERVTVRLTRGAVPGLRLSAEDCTLYLGRGEGTTVLWNNSEKVTVRIPTSDVVLESEETQQSC